MRIAVYHDLPSGGAKRTLYEVVRRLSKRHSFDIFTLTTANHDFCDVRPYAGRQVTAEFHPLPLFPSPFGRLNQFQRWRSLAQLDRLSVQIAAEIDAQGYDLVYVHPCMWTQAPAVLKYLKTTSVYHIQEPLRKVYEPEIPRPYLNLGWREKIDRVDPLIQKYRSLLIQIDRESTQRATCLLANSKYTAENIRRFYGCSAEVSYFGVDTEAFYPIQGTKRENFLLSVGALEPIKGFDLIIQSIGRLPGTIRPPLKIVGNASNWQEQAYLSDQAKVWGVDLAVETMVDHQKLVRLYNQAAFLVYTPVREPFGLVPLEAMACGTAVVGVAEGGVLETIVDGVNGRLVSRDPDQLPAVIKSLLEDPQVLEHLRQNTRGYVLEQWNWGRAVDALEVQLRNAAAIPREQRVSN